MDLSMFGNQCISGGDMIPRMDENGVYIKEDELMGMRELFSKQHRVLFFSGPIGMETESCNTLMMLDAISHEPIKIIISSPGGVLDTAILIYDTMNLLSSPIYTLCRYAASAAVIPLAAGNKRYVMPHAKTMLHLVSGGTQGDLEDMTVQTQQIIKAYNDMIDILIECGVKRTRKEVMADIKKKREVWMDAKETIAYGIADDVMTAKVMREWLL